MALALVGFEVDDFAVVFFAAAFLVAVFFVVVFAIDRPASLGVGGSLASGCFRDDRCGNEEKYTA